MAANADSMKRQLTINEWEYNHKLELLFILQLLFLGLILIVLLSVLSKRGIFGKAFVIYVSVIIFIIIGILWFLRSAYTKNIRDRFLWSRRYFSGDGSKPATISPETVKAAAEATQQVCDAAKTGDLSNALKNPPVTTSSKC
jgi:FlaA1/EpsC-like NDP-sugar epimerase